MADKKKSALQGDNMQLELVFDGDDTYDAFTGYALLSGTELPPVLREDEMEI